MMIQRRDLNQSKIDKLWEENEGFDLRAPTWEMAKLKWGCLGGMCRKILRWFHSFPRFAKFPKKWGSTLWIDCLIISHVAYKSVDVRLKIHVKPSSPL